MLEGQHYIVIYQHQQQLLSSKDTVVSYNTSEVPQKMDSGIYIDIVESSTSMQLVHLHYKYS